MAEDAVLREPVSTANSLLTGKNTGKFRQKPESEHYSPPKFIVEIGSFGEIPYAREQGTSRGIAGTIALEAGNFSARPYPLTLLRADLLMSAFRGLEETSKI
jgi:hypothetical protein